MIYFFLSLTLGRLGKLAYPAVLGSASRADSELFSEKRALQPQRYSRSFVTIIFPISPRLHRDSLAIVAIVAIVQPVSGLSEFSRFWFSFLLLFTQALKDQEDNLYVESYLEKGLCSQCSQSWHIRNTIHAMFFAVFFTCCFLFSFRRLYGQAASASESAPYGRSSDVSCDLSSVKFVNSTLTSRLFIQFHTDNTKTYKSLDLWCMYDIVCLSLLVFETGVWDIFETLHVARSLAQLVGIRRKTCCDFVPNVASKEFLGVRRSLSLQYYNVEVKLICVRRKCDVWRCTMFDSCRTSHSSTLLIFSHLLSFMPINSAEFSWGYLLCSLFVAGACLHQPGALQQTSFVNQQFYANCKFMDIHIHE